MNILEFYVRADRSLARVLLTYTRGLKDAHNGIYQRVLLLSLREACFIALTCFSRRFVCGFVIYVLEDDYAIGVYGNCSTDFDVHNISTSLYLEFYLI